MFQVSNKSGLGLDLFIYFLNLLPLNPSNQWNINRNDSAEFHITETFDKKDGDPIIYGMVMSGSIS